MTGYGDIGSYVIAGSSDFNTVSTGYNPGTTVAGSTLSRALPNAGGGSNSNNVALNMWCGGNFNGFPNGSTMNSSYGDQNLGLSGTWRSMTYAYSSAGYAFQNYMVALFVRIA
jgi:hypothetical protein